MKPRLQEEPIIKKNLTEIVSISGRSGSTSGLEKDTIGGFNFLIPKQYRSDEDIKKRGR